METKCVCNKSSSTLSRTLWNLPLRMALSRSMRHIWRKRMPLWSRFRTRESASAKKIRADCLRSLENWRTFIRWTTKGSVLVLSYVSISASAMGGKFGWVAVRWKVASFHLRWICLLLSTETALSNLRLQYRWLLSKGTYLTLTQLQFSSEYNLQILKYFMNDVDFVYKS